MSCNEEFIKTQCNYKNDYECQRKCNISKLKDLYNSELQNYYSEYNKYLEYKYDRTSQASRKKAEAENIIRPKVIRINSVLNKILSDLKKNINYTQNMISQQEVDIDNKNNDIYNRNIKITNQFNTITKKKQELGSKKAMIDSGIERNKYKRNTMYFLIVLNLIIIGVIAKLLIK